MSPFLTSAPFEAVRDALTGRRSAVRTATKTQRCDLWGCPAQSKSRLNSCVFSGMVRPRVGRPPAFLWHAYSHGQEQRALFSADRPCVCERLALPLLLSRPPQTLLDEYVSFAVVSLKYGQMKTHQWIKPVYTTCSYSQRPSNLQQPQHPTMTETAANPKGSAQQWFV